jgi:hypothetical protein
MPTHTYPCELPFQKHVQFGIYIHLWYKAQLHMVNACHPTMESYYGSACIALAGVRMGMGGGPRRSQLPSGSLRTFHARFGSGCQ